MTDTTRQQSQKSRFRPKDIVAGLGSELFLMLIIFIVLSIGVIFVASKLPKTYPSNASILVRLGADYVYQPQVGDAARGATTNSEELVLAEAEILQSAELFQRLIKEIGNKRLLEGNKKLAEPKSPIDAQAADIASLKMLAKGVKVQTAPKNNVIRIGFEHENAETAALVVNKLIDSYINYRKDVFIDPRESALLEQRSIFDQRLEQANRTYRDFLKSNGVVDFDSARSTYTKIYDQIMSDLYTTQVQISQSHARLNQLNLASKSVDPEVGLERTVDLSLPSKIRDLKVQREELLSRFQSTALPVQAIDAQIIALEARLKQDGITDRELKLGRSRSFEELLTLKINAQSEHDSLIARKRTLEEQGLKVMAEMQNLYGLEAQNNSMALEREALNAQMKDFSLRIEEAKAKGGLAQSTNEMVRIISPAIPATTPKSLKKIAIIAGVFFAFIFALFIGLMRVLLQKGFRSAEHVEDTLDVPVLVRAQKKPEKKA